MMQIRHFLVAALAGLVLVSVSPAVQRERAVKKSEGGGEAKADETRRTVPQPAKVVMLKTNGEEITVEDYVNFLQRNPMYAQASMSQAGKAEVLRAIVTNQLLKGDMARKGLLPMDQEKAKAELNKAYEKLAEQHFPLPPPPDEKTVYQFYLDHKNEYGIPEMVRVSQIQFRLPENSNEEQKTSVRNRAEEALKRIEKGESFAKVAGELTENPLAKLPEGDLGFLARDADPWFSKVLQDLKTGEHTQVIESSVGYEILKLTDVRPALISPYANVREKIVQRIQLEGQTKLRNAYVKGLAKTAKIEIVQEELKRLFPQGIFP